MSSRPPFHPSAALAATILGLVGLLAAGQAHATAVRGHSVEELTLLAPHIVHGKVGQVQSRWDDGYRSISTYVEIRVTERLKGKASGVILVKQPGGIVGEIGQKVSGAAAFVPDEEVVLFLEETGERDVFGVMTLAAGKVAFEKNRRGEVRAKRHLEGLALVEPQGFAPPRIWTVDEDDLGSPGDFLARVRAAIANKRGRP